jgi:hypothetical protein
MLIDYTHVMSPAPGCRAWLGLAGAMVQRILKPVGVSAGGQGTCGPRLGSGANPFATLMWAAGGRAIDE